MQIVFEGVGYVSNTVQDKKDTSWGEDISIIKLKEEYEGGFRKMESVISRAL